MKNTFKNAEIVLFDRNIKGSLIIENQLIKKISTSIENEGHVIDCQNLKIFPGFIETHTHGGYGFDFEQNSIDAYQSISRNIVKEGVTKYLLASVTARPENISDCLKTFAKFYQNQNNKHAKCLGVHLEGPFISLEKKGAHKPDLILKPDLKWLKKWIGDSNNLIKIVTFDIDNDENSQFLKFLNANNIIGSIGHSNASSQTFKEKAGDVGCFRVTHLYNGMSGLTHSNPGIAAAALNDSRVLCELICDGFHVKKDLIWITYRCKGSQKITLITDAVSAKGQANGYYKLGELDIEKKDGICVLKGTNTLAGSATTYDQCFKNFHDWIKPTDQELAHISSYNSAKQLGLKDTGLIKENYLADLVIVDSNYQVVATICEGQIAYVKKEYNRIFN